MINQLDHPADQRERERERVVNLEKRLRVFSIGLIGTTIIAMGAIIFVLIRPAESATTPGTCLPIEKGGTGCDYMALRNAMGLGNSTSALPIANGGTGAMDAATARTNLGLGNLSTINSPLPIANGGSGMTVTQHATVTAHGITFYFSRWGKNAIVYFAGITTSAIPAGAWTILNNIPADFAVGMASGTRAVGFLRLPSTGSTFFMLYAGGRSLWAEGLPATAAGNWIGGSISYFTI